MTAKAQDGEGALRQTPVCGWRSSEL